MAPSPDDPRNPFESFRRFADDQMSALMRSLTGHPTPRPRVATSEPFESDDDLPWIVRGMDKEARRRYRDCMVDEKHLTSNPAEANRPDPKEEESWRCPYRPAAQEESESPPDLAREIMAGNPFFGSSGLGTLDQYLKDEFGVDDPSSWPLQYLLTSTYSPLRLETQHPSNQQGHQWRHAFRDLIALQNELDMGNLDSSCSNHYNSPHWYDWPGSLTDRGFPGASLPDRTNCENFCDRSGWAITPDDRLAVLRLFQAEARDRDEELRKIHEASSQDEPDSVLDALLDAARRIRRLLCVRTGIEEMRCRNEAFNRWREDEGEDVDEDDEDDKADDDDDDDDNDGSNGEQEEDLDEQEQLTELDLYERLTGLQGGLFGADFTKRMAAEAFKQERELHVVPTTHAQDGDDKKPSVISTLTTTERRTLPDGSVHTKMMLKKRFADGREESTETTHTTKENQTTPQQKSIKDDGSTKTEPAPKIEKYEQKKKGWFWSS